MRDRTVHIFTCQLAHRFYSFCLFAALLICIGCGGGTEGTGVKFIDGTVTTAGGAALPNIRVTVLSTGATADSDANGRFAIETEVGAGPLDLSVVSAGVTSAIQIADLPKGDVRVTLALEVNEATNSVTDSNINLAPVEDDSDSSSTPENATDLPVANGSDGTSPTANTSGTVIRGVLSDAQGLALVGVKIQIAGTNVTVVTDSFGNFVLPAFAATGPVTLIVEDDGVSHEIHLDGVSSNTQSVDLQAVQEIDNSEFTLLDADYTLEPEKPEDSSDGDSTSPQTDPSTPVPDMGTNVDGQTDPQNPDGTSMDDGQDDGQTSTDDNGGDQPPPRDEEEGGDE